MDYDAEGKLLFMQTVRIMIAEMEKRYKQVSDASHHRSEQH